MFVPRSRVGRGVVDSGGGAEGAYRIRAIFILPINASWEARCDQAGNEIGGLGREVQRGGPVGVLADAVVFVAGVDEELLSLVQLLSWCTGWFWTGLVEQMGEGNTYGDLK